MVVNRVLMAVSPAAEAKMCGRKFCKLYRLIHCTTYQRINSIHSYSLVLSFFHNTCEVNADARWTNLLPADHPVSSLKRVSHNVSACHSRTECIYTVTKHLKTRVNPVISRCGLKLIFLPDNLSMVEKRMKWNINTHALRFFSENLTQYGRPHPRGRVLCPTSSSRGYSSCCWFSLSVAFETHDSKEIWRSRLIDVGCRNLQLLDFSV